MTNNAASSNAIQRENALPKETGADGSEMLAAGLLLAAVLLLTVGWKRSKAKRDRAAHLSSANDS